MRYPAQAQHIELSQDDQMMQFSCSFTTAVALQLATTMHGRQHQTGKKQQSYTERMCDAGLRQNIIIDDVAAISSISYMYQQLTGRTKRRQQCIRKDPGKAMQHGKKSGCGQQCSPSSQRRWMPSEGYKKSNSMTWSLYSLHLLITTAHCLPAGSKSRPQIAQIPGRLTSD